MRALLPWAHRRRSSPFPRNCDGISGVNEASNSTVTGCLKPVINYHSLIAASDAVRRVVAGQLAGAVSSSPNLQASRWRGLKMSPHASLATTP